MDKKTRPQLVIIIALVVLCTYLYFFHTEVSSSCLLDEFENANITELSNSYASGYINENWTIGQVYGLYYAKGRSRAVALTGIDYYLGKCKR